MKSFFKNKKNILFIFISISFTLVALNYTNCVSSLKNSPESSQTNGLSDLVLSKDVDVKIELFTKDQLAILDDIIVSFEETKLKIFNEKGDINIPSEEAYKIVVELYSVNDENILNLTKNFIEFMKSAEDSLSPKNVPENFLSTLEYLQQTRKRKGTIAMIHPPLSSPGVKLAIGTDHSCAIQNHLNVCSDESLYCWGNNSSGQLGIGSFTGSNSTPQHVQLPGKPLTISLGNMFTCAIIDHAGVNELYCWGDNSGGQLGLGITNPPQNIPTKVSLLPGSPKTVSAGYRNTCSISNVSGTDRLYCWGENDMGQIGVGTTGNSPNYFVPQQVTLPGIPKTVAAGTRAVCAITTVSGADSLYCWGMAISVGTGTTSNQNTPQLVTLPFLPQSVSIGASGQVCAIANQNQYCWGANNYGQLGIGTANPMQLTPQPVSTNLPIQSISAGESHTCSISNINGFLQMECRGWNHYGQLGNGNNTDFYTPQSIPFPPGILARVVSMASGGHHTCTELNTGGPTNKIYCAGGNSMGQLGNNSTQDSNVLQPVDFSAFLNSSNTCSLLATGDWTACAITDLGNLKCWGDNTEGEVGIGSSGGIFSSAQQTLNSNGSALANISAVSGGQNETCAIQNGAVYCWGQNNPTGGIGLGNIGIGISTQSFVPTPTQVNGLSSNVSAISVGFLSVCAIQSGQVYCWGDNAAGQLGNSSHTNSAIPVAVNGLSNATAISVGEGYACAIQNGTAMCWGAGYATSPLFVGWLPSPVTSITTGLNLSCGVHASGSISCWSNSCRSSSCTYQIPGLTSGVTTVSLSGFFNPFGCALMNTRTVKCWGDNSNGQLGNNSMTNSNVAVDVLNPQGTAPLNDVIAISSGYMYACARIRTGETFCWGAANQFSSYGVIGNGTSTAGPMLPTTVLNFP